MNRLSTTDADSFTITLSMLLLPSAVRLLGVLNSIAELTTTNIYAKVIARMGGYVSKPSAVQTTRNYVRVAEPSFDEKLNGLAAEP
jgi:hypothetical protein